MFSYKDYIYAIYQERSFSKAAQKLFVSQSWLSSVVKKTEQEIKAPLFDRSTVPISMTEAGLYYIRQAEKIMAVEEETRRHFLRNDRRSRRRTGKPGQGRGQNLPEGKSTLQYRIEENLLLQSPHIPI